MPVFKRCIEDRDFKVWFQSRLRTKLAIFFITMQPVLIMVAGLAGALGVGLGAFGAHALKDILELNHTGGIWQTAVAYHLTHSLALLALAGWRSDGVGRLPSLLIGAAICWMAGILFFSGSLYGLALGAPRIVGLLTPIGGLFLLAGWTLVMLRGWQCRNTPNPSP